MFKRPSSFSFDYIIFGQVSIEILAVYFLLELLLDQFEGGSRHAGVVDVLWWLLVVGLELEC